MSQPQAWKLDKLTVEVFLDAAQPNSGCSLILNSFGANSNEGFVPANHWFDCMLFKMNRLRALEETLLKAIPSS